jgi:hypothetical protein
MPLPPDALILREPLDPRDIEKYTCIITKKGIYEAPFPTLDPTENIASYILAPDAAAVALGLEVMNSTPYHTTLSGLFLNFAVRISPAMRALRDWRKETQLALQIGITTDADAPRVKWRTIGLIVRAR